MLDRLRRLAASRAALAVPLALAAAGYARVVRGEFQFDDQVGVVENVGLKDLPSFVGERFVPQLLGGGRAVTDLTFALNYAWSGLDAWTYHLVNVLIHLAVAVLVWAFTRTTLRAAGVARPEGISAFVAGVFALHPIQTEAVSYVVQRSESLASGLYVATLLLVLAAERRGPTRRAAPIWIAALATFALALGSKAIALTMPLAWMLFAAVVPAPASRRELLSWRMRALAVAPFAALGGAFAARTLAGIAGRADAGFSVPGLSPTTYLFTQARAVAVYLRLLAWPAGQSVEWDFRTSRSLAEPAVLLSGGLLVALLAAAVGIAAAARRRDDADGAAGRVVAFGVLWFFLLLSVTSSVVPLADLVVEHRLYLASWGVFLAAAVAGERLLSARGAARLAPVAGGLAWLALTALTFHRNGVWESRVALFSDAAAKAPAKARPRLSLAHALAEAGNLEGAVRENRAALERSGGDRELELQILRNLGAVYVQLGRTGDAAQTLLRASERAPWDGEILNNLAIAYVDAGDLGEAERVARRAVQASPGLGGAWTTLGEVRLRRGDARDALDHFERAIRLDPDVPVRHYWRGEALAALGKDDAACAAFSTAALARDPVVRAAAARSQEEHRCAARPVGHGGP